MYLLRKTSRIGRHFFFHESFNWAMPPSGSYICIKTKPYANKQKILLNLSTANINSVQWNDNTNVRFAHVINKKHLLYLIKFISIDLMEKDLINHDEEKKCYIFTCFRDYNVQCWVIITYFLKFTTCYTAYVYNNFLWYYYTDFFKWYNHHYGLSYFKMYSSEYEHNNDVHNICIKFRSEMRNDCRN